MISGNLKLNYPTGYKPNSTKKYFSNDEFSYFILEPVKIRFCLLFRY